MESGEHGIEFIVVPVSRDTKRKYEELPINLLRLVNHIFERLVNDFYEEVDKAMDLYDKTEQIEINIVFHTR